GANEVCGDGIDNNCNGTIDTADRNAVGCMAGCSDQDGDAFSPDGGSCGPIDCNDNDPEINPGALEICNDGNDNNCNSKTDGADGVCQDPRVNEPHWWRPDTNAVNPVPTPNPTPGPAANPVDLRAASDSNAVRLNWSLTGIIPRAQEIYRDTDANPRGRGRVGFMRNGTEFVDNNVTPGVTYYYWIKVTESNGTVTNSQAAAVTASSNAPAPAPAPAPYPAPGTQHPFGWSNPRSQHQHEHYSVDTCTSCHTIDPASRDSALSCYRCHGNEWGGSGDDDYKDDDRHDDRDHDKDDDHHDHRHDD
ncbi:MAG: MopE-related protein, partial [Candidatus Thiodiazotropha sp.]